MAEEKKQKNPLPDRFVTVQAPTTYSGTVKKAMAFVSKSPIEAHGVKGMKSTPWRKTFKSPEHLDQWADANQAEVHGTRATKDVDMLGRGLGPDTIGKALPIQKEKIGPFDPGRKEVKISPAAKEALKDWYRNVYKKSFSYECPGCGHKDTVREGY